MKSCRTIQILLICFVPALGYSQFEMITDSMIKKPEIQHILKMDSAVFDLATDYVHKRISKLVMTKRVQELTKNYEAEMNRMAPDERLFCKGHKQQCANSFLDGTWRKRR